MWSAPGAQGPLRLPLNVRVAIILLAFWTVSQVVAAIPSFPTEIRQVLVRTKVMVGPAVLLLIALTSKVAFRARPAFVGMLVFSAYTAFNSMVRAEPNWPRALLVTAWAGCFMLIPSLLNSRPRIELFIRMVIPSLLASVTLAAVLGVLTDDYIEIGGNRGRYYFGMNPNYFAALAATMAFGGFISLILTPKHNRTWAWLSLIGGIVLTYLTDSRTQLVMLAVAFSVYGAYSRGLIARISQLFIGFGLLFSAGLIVFISSPLVSVERLNEVASGRILLWYSLLKTNLGSGEILPLLWGQTNLQFDTSSADWRKLNHMTIDAFDRGSQAQATFTRIAFDNAYLDVLLMTGLIGLVLALWAWIRWWRALRAEPYESEFTRRSKGVARALIMGILVTGFFASSWPAIGNVTVSFSLVLAIALTTLTRRAESSPPPVSRARETWNPPGRIR